MKDDQTCQYNMTPSTYGVHEEPMHVDNISTEEELGTLESLGEEIRGKDGDPFEYRETSTGFQHEHGNSLLGEQTDDNGRPV